MRRWRYDFNVPGRLGPAEASPAGAALEPEDPPGNILFIGPDIAFKGRIFNCDTIIVHGDLEASVEARGLHIGDDGRCRGKVAVETADIAGQFSGELTARERLVIRSTGRVEGKLLYNRLVVEDGGSIVGQAAIVEEPAVSVAVENATRVAGVLPSGG